MRGKLLSSHHAAEPSLLRGSRNAETVGGGGGKRLLKETLNRDVFLHIEAHAMQYSQRRGDDVDEGRARCLGQFEGGA